MKREHQILFLVASLLLLVGCKSSRVIPTYPKEQLSIASRVSLSASDKGITIGGQLSLKEGEIIQISLRMPIVGIEVGRIELTPRTILLIDRLNKKYSQLSWDEAQQKVGNKTTYMEIESHITQLYKKGGGELTPFDFGVHSRKKIVVSLYNFSKLTKELVETTVPSRYEYIGMDQLIELFKAI